jgi:polyisoprenoid-binding protein YceI
VNARRLAGGMVLAGIVAVCAAAAADLDPAGSTLVAQYRQMNVPVDAPFHRFSGSVQFDPAQPAAAVAHIEIDTASFDLGDEDYNSEVRKPEWFDCAHFPKASFDAKGLQAAGPGKYQTDGTLSFKGKSQLLRVLLTVSSRGGASVFEGAVPISRAYFQIGGPDWKDSVDDQVLVKFRIVTPPKH